MDELKTLIRLARLALDEKRKALSALQARDDSLQAEIMATHQALAAEQAKSQAVMEGGLTLGAYIAAQHQCIKKLEKARIALASEIELAQDALRRAFEELKRYEIALEQRLETERRDRLRKESKAMDEAGSIATHRKVTGDGTV